MKKLVFAILFYIVLAVILLPGILTFLFHIQPTPKQAEDPEEVIEVYRPDIINTSNNTLEEYIKGVVAAEMPALFPEEALKAQAVAARTYTIHSLAPTGKTTIHPEEIGQAYLSVEELKKQWGKNFPVYYKKISDAVDATYGEIMVYEEEPILAVFHAESAGKTETAENVWEQSIPYLQSVDSSLDEKAPDFEKQVTFTCQEAANTLSSRFAGLGLDADNLQNQLQIKNRSSSGYIQEIQVGSKILTGKQVREALGLRSANFAISYPTNNTLCFTTKGYGHGAGMSQYGASFMAEDGNNYREILQHYYTGIDFKEWEKIDLFAE